MSLRQRLFAAGYRFVANATWLEEYRRRTAGAARGDVLEIGPGTGANLRFYAPDVRLTGLEPNPHMVRLLMRQATRLGRQITVVSDVSRGLPFPDASFDTVVSTLVLCSVPDVASTLAEVRRVLRPDGTFTFLEHVAAPQGTGLRRWQDRLNRPWWGWIGDGCNCNRQTGATIRGAGFADVTFEEVLFPRATGLVRPAIVGVAHT